MAAYASAVTKYTEDVQRISRDLGILCGRIDITNYNSTTTEETSITRYFKASGTAAIAKGILSLVITSSEKGYVAQFDKTTGKFKVYQAPAQTHSHDLSLKNAAVADGATTRVNAGINLLGANTGSDITVAGGGANGGVASATLAAAVLTEVPNDTDCGTFDFIAIGLIAGSAR